MLSQVTDGSHAESLRFAASHHQRISIVEPERLRHSNTKFCERLANFVERQRASALQNLLRNCPRIFRVGNDLSAAQRLPKNDRATHSLAMFYWNSRVG